MEIHPPADAPLRPSDFMRSLGHELRNVMSTIAVSVEVLQTGAGGAETGQMALAILARQTARLDTVVATGLTLAKVIDGGVNLSLQRLDLAVLMARVVDELQLRQRLPLVLGVAFVEADAAYLAQALKLLLSPIAAGCGGDDDPGGDDFTLVDVAIVQDGADVALRIAPDGAGTVSMPKPSLCSLGELLAQALIRLHGGSVEPPPIGRGFVVRLPIAPLAPVALRAASA